MDLVMCGIASVSCERTTCLLGSIYLLRVWCLYKQTWRVCFFTSWSLIVSSFTVTWFHAHEYKNWNCNSIPLVMNRPVTPWRKSWHSEGAKATPPENYRRSPKKEPFQKDRIVFQALFFRGRVSFRDEIHWGSLTKIKQPSQAASRCKL